MYAKWRLPNTWVWPRGWTIESHTEKCLLAFDWLTEYEFIDDLYNIMSIERFVNLETFKRYCQIAITLHDIGKANSEFQGMIENKEKLYNKYCDDPKINDILFQNSKKQKIRHEFCSLIFLAENEEWFKRFAGEHYHYILAAIYGHHIKTDRLCDSDEEPFKLDIYSEHIICLIKKFFPSEKDAKFNHYNSPMFDIKNRKYRKFISRAAKNNSLSYALKYVLIICDTLGSMTSSAEQDNFEIELREYIKSILDKKSFNVIGEHRIDPKAIETPFPYQTECRNKDGSFIVNIGCGGGKTATAFYACADKDLICDKNIVFTVPLTSASAQLFLSVGSKDDGNRTSRSIIDKELFLGSSEEENDKDSNEIFNSFENMFDEVTFATTDQILGVVSYSRKSIFWLLHLINSKIVFDEFHSYDETMTFWLEEFLRIFPKIDVVCMSATSTNSQENLIKKYRPNVNIINNQNTEPLTASRYRFEIISEAQAANFFDLNKRTLWMVNTVAKAQDIANRFLDSLIFHAKYKYQDKVKKQKHFVEVFKTGKPVRAVCTQIGEMSLDIYADQMITEMCPCADLIQRIGRASPRGQVPKNITTIYCYRPETVRPYSNNDIDECEWFINTLLNKNWSLKDLIEHFKENIDKNNHKKNIYTQEIYITSRLSTRDQNATANCILQNDVEKIENELRTNNKAIQKYEFSLYENEIPKIGLTMLKHRAIVSKDYDERLGVIK